jgi:hypothetical protein
MNNFEQQSYNRHSNNNNINGRNYPKSAPVNQHPFRYANEDRSREYYNSTYHPNEQQINNNSYRLYNQRRCFGCGEFDHIKANCPLLKKTNSGYQQKSSS